MLVHRVTPILNVSDVPASLDWFAAIGWKPSFTWNAGGTIEAAASHNAHGPADFAGIFNGHAEIFLCHGAQGARDRYIPPGYPSDETGGNWMSWWMTSPKDVDALYARVQSLGYETATAPRDEPWGVREFHLRHPDGHTFRISAGLGG